MTIQEAELIKNAKKPFEMNYKDGDEVSIVSDTGMEPIIWSSLLKAARSLGIEPTLIIMAEPPRSAAEPPKPVEEAIRCSDWVIIATSKATMHSEAIRYAKNEDDTGIVAMSEVTPEMLASDAASADYSEIQRIGEKVANIISEGDEIEIITEAGTLKTSIEGRDGVSEAGQPNWLTNGCGFPGGEVFVSPVEGTANGSININVTMHEVGRIEEPIVLEFEDGYITEIQGGKEANIIKETLKKVDDKNAYNLAEVAVQTNPGAEIMGKMRTDKKKLGYIHIAVGENDGMGGNIPAPIHLDGVIKDAELKVDGETIVKSNNLLIK